MANKEKIDELLTRGVGSFIDPDGIFRKKLETNPEKITIKFGIDPTRPDIHLGHAVVLRKLREFQDLGCKVIFLVGDFTAQIGDPTGKSKIRPEISQEEATLIMETYVQQIPKILKIEPISEEDKRKNKEIIRDSNSFIVDSPWFGWMRNSDWFVNVTDIISHDASKKGLAVKNEKGQMFELQKNSFFEKAVLFDNTRMQKLIQKKDIKTTSLINFIAVLRKISLSQLLERDMFQERIKKGEPLFMHEMIYPVVQGIDSDVIAQIYGSCDLEVGGTDQTFNMLMGRKVMEMTGKQKNEIQSVLAFKLLEGTDGKDKMSKSLDNYIGINDEPNDMYGKVMSIPDSSIINYFELCTVTSLDEIKEIKKKLEAGSVNPKDIKMKLAFEIVKIYHEEEKAKEAEQYFINTFQKKEIPDEMPDFVMKDGETLMLISVKNGLVSSNSEFRRLVEEKAITNLDTEENISDTTFIPENNSRFRIGKKRFFRIIKNN